MNQSQKNTQLSSLNLPGKPSADCHPRQTDGSPAEPVLLESIIPYLINRLAYKMNRALNADLQRHGLHISHWRVLSVLDVNPAISINDLADYAMIEQSTLSRLLVKMEGDGLLERERACSDGRVRNVSLTHKGRQIYDTLRELALSHSQRVVECLSADQQATLHAMVAAMNDSLGNGSPQTEVELIARCGD